METTPFSIQTRVYIEDTDAGGIVYYANYLKFMERARTELLRSHGFGKAGANAEAFQFVVVESKVKYIQPARLDDELCVNAQVVKCGAASAIFEQQVLCKGELICQGEIKVACVGGQSLKPMAMPMPIRDILDAYQ